MKKTDIKTLKRQNRHARIRARVIGDAERPRLSVFRSNKYVYAQIIDDTKGQTLCSSSSLSMKGKPLEKAIMVGKEIAEKAKIGKISKVVFDRGGYLYTGTIKAIADAARQAGLDF